MREARVASELDAIGWFGGDRRVAADSGSVWSGVLSHWLFAVMAKAGLTVELLETRHVRAAFKAMAAKSDRNDARGIAESTWLGRFRPVHCKSLPAQEVRALPTARRLMQGKLPDLEMSCAAFCAASGGRSARRRGGVRGPGARACRGPADADGDCRGAAGGPCRLARELAGLEKRRRGLARLDTRTRLLMSTPELASSWP